MQFRIFTLHPNIFTSFISESLIARAISKEIIAIETVNWRDLFGVGSYRQVDDRPFGGGSGMVLMSEPIYNALDSYSAVSHLFQSPVSAQEHTRLTPNNAVFFDTWNKSKLKPKSVTIMLTPRGFPLKQPIAEWLTNFSELNILCGRYEGFDARVSECVDLELSIGDFVLNGGEVAAMSLVESVARLLPDFITKETSVQHESFSTRPNYYPEQVQSNSKQKVTQRKLSNSVTLEDNLDFFADNLFDNSYWLSQIAPNIEHPQYTRPEEWRGFVVPTVLRSGNHHKIQEWRHNWYSKLTT